MTTKYTDEQVLKLLNEVELEFGNALKKAEFPAKEDEDSEEDKKEDAAEKAPIADDKDAKVDAEAADDAPKADDSKEDEGSKEDIKEDAQEDAVKDPQAEDFDYDDDDHAELHKMYSSMGQKEKQAHLDSLHKALGVVAKQPEAQPMANPMAKSEELSKKEETYALIKSENDTLKAKNDELQKNMEIVKSFLATVQKSVPQRKSIESLDFIKKNEDQEKTLTQNEIDVLILKKGKDANLSKSDRLAIDNYYLNGKSVETIKHLLK